MLDQSARGKKKKIESKTKHPESTASMSVTANLRVASGAMTVSLRNHEKGSKPQGWAVLGCQGGWLQALFSMQAQCASEGGTDFFFKSLAMCPGLKCSNSMSNQRFLLLQVERDAGLVQTPQVLYFDK